jgi:hypothetical protein
MSVKLPHTHTHTHTHSFTNTHPFHRPHLCLGAKRVHVWNRRYPPCSSSGRPSMHARVAPAMYACVCVYAAHAYTIVWYIRLTSTHTHTHTHAHVHTHSSPEYTNGWDSHTQVHFLPEVGESSLFHHIHTRIQLLSGLQAIVCVRVCVCVCVCWVHNNRIMHTHNRVCVSV